VEKKEDPREKKEVRIRVTYSHVLLLNRTVPKKREGDWRGEGGEERSEFDNIHVL